MPWRMFGVIGFLIVVTVFSALNLDNRSDVSVGVYTFANVPVFLTGLISFILGAVLILPLTLRRGAQRRTPATGDGRPPPSQLTDQAGPTPEGSDPAEATAEPQSSERRPKRWPFGDRRRSEEPD